jgi:hypothetical protein
MNAHKAEQNRTFRPKPLTPEQLNAIDLLIIGKTDAEVCTVVGVGRTTLYEWRKSPVFLATLELERQALFRAPIERLRGLAAKAIDNISGAIEDGHIKWSFELLKACGMYGALLPEAESDPDKLLDNMVMRELARSYIPSHRDTLEALSNPARAQREKEIREELQAEYGESEP